MKSKNAPASSASNMNRRRFLAAAGLAAAAPNIICTRSWGAEKRAAPSERITMGVVGWGMQGPSNTAEFLKLPNCQVVATCNIDKNHLQASLDKINGHYGNKDCKAYHDYREMMARTDIDTVMLPVPDN